MNPALPGAESPIGKEKQIMAEPKLKAEKAEKAITRLVGQMDKTVAKRKWRPATYAALITYTIEAYGGKFPDTDSRNAFRSLMEDSDYSFSSNMKKYLANRGILPKEEPEEEQKFE